MQIRKPSQSRTPTRSELLAAADKTVPDVVAPGLQVLFCGINPGLYSAWVGHHFGRPGNRFWPALLASGFTDRLLRPQEEYELLRLGYGITNLVDRATLGSDELTRDELVAGAQRLEVKTNKYRPRALAILGISTYRMAFSDPRAIIGLQPEKLAGALVWVLPNPSGRNAHFTPKALKSTFRDLRRHIMKDPGSVGSGLSRND